MIRVAHLSDDRRAVVSVSIQAAEWVDDGKSVASDTANIGDTFDGTAFAPPAAPAMTPAQWIAFANSKIEATYNRKRHSLASYYTLLDRMERKGDLSVSQKADLDLLDAAQHWEQAMLDAAAQAASPGDDLASFKWPAPPAGLADLVALS